MHPQLRDLLEFWHRKCAGRRMPARRDFDVFELRQWLGRLHLVQVAGGGEDFVFTIYGSDIAVLHGSDFTGKALSSIADPARESVRRAYAATCRSRAPLFVEDDPLVRSSLTRLENLILPLSDDGRTVDRILIGVSAVERRVRQEGSPVERRRAARTAILCAGRLRTDEGWQNCVVLDYSSLGARVQMESEAPLIGASAVEFADFAPISARIVWRCPNRLGLEFATRIAAAGGN
jgi:hypothetical protein